MSKHPEGTRPSPRLSQVRQFSISRSLCESTSMKPTLLTTSKSNPSRSTPHVAIRSATILLVVLLLLGNLQFSAIAQEYSTYKTWDAMHASTNSKFSNATRVSGTDGYTGFWFFGIEQFDIQGRDQGVRSREAGAEAAPAPPHTPVIWRASR